MKWDSNAPLALLASMPAKLNKNNLEKLQSVIDNDKYKCSMAINKDLCGEYAPFCAICDKSVKFPCAVAYVNMKKAEGVQLEVAATDDDADDEVQTAEEAEPVLTEEVSNPEPAEQPEEFAEPVAAEEIDAEDAPAEEEPAELPQTEEETPAGQKEKIRIRIAIAKRK